MPRFKLTGQTISQELTDVLQKLEKGTYVPIEDIENTPEIRLARTCINNSISTEKISGRETLRINILNELQKTADLKL